MNLLLDQVSCASLPQTALPFLADFRRREDIQIGLEGNRAWVRWSPGDREILLRLLPIPGVQLYFSKNDTWYRHGRHLPSFDVPDELTIRPLSAVLTPA